MKNIGIIYPNQLFEVEYFPYDPKIIDYFIIVEDPIFFSDSERKLNFNMLKLIYQRACMKYYESYLLKLKYNVLYVEWQNKSDLVFQFIKKKFGINNKLHVIDPVDWLLENRINKFGKKTKQDIILYDTPAFLFTNNMLETYIKSKNIKNTNTRLFYQYNFYIWHRKNSNILMNKDGKPVGGKYSYDKYNRKPFPKNGIDTLLKKIKPTVKIYHHTFYADAIAYCEARFPNHYPENYHPENIYFYPITHLDSKNHLKNFIKYKLKLFGDYQDAIYYRETDDDILNYQTGTLYHSIISMQQNIGLLIPSYVQKTIINYFKKSGDKKILPDVEGFIRQLNWREYSRLLYRYAYDDIVNSNYFGNNKHLTKEWYTGETGIEPLDLSIKYAMRYGYLHHIIRLMIMSNFMNLCMINPHDVYKWFMEFSLDSYDWVMVNNVYSMGLYADGGLTMTKPYISSSNYIRRMSNAKKDTHWEIVWDVLYYYFIYRNYKKLKGRAKIYLPQWDNQTNQRKELIIKNAKMFIKQNTKN